MSFDRASRIAWLKQELTRIPIYGWIALKGGNIVVDRSGGSAALRKLVADSRDRLEEELVDLGLLEYCRPALERRS